MRNRDFRVPIGRAAAAILAAALAVFLAVPALAAEAQMNRTSDRLIEITGGAGSHAWRLRYGTDVWQSSGPEFAPRFLPVPGGRAYFARGDWLRLIDAGKGQVIGRWHFPGLITRLTAGAAPGGIEVEVFNFNGPKEKFRRTLPFDPAAPAVPYWPLGELHWIHAARVEAEMGAWAPTGGSVLSARSKLPPDVARKLVPETQEAVRRDPLSPWFQVRLGKLLRDAGDARATSVWRQALEVPSTDFTELLPISSFLDEAGEYELGRAGFERGYQDFFQRGNDPRLFATLFGRVFTYPPPRDAERSGPAYRAELIDRLYRLSPSGDGAVLAWRIYADDLEKSGHPDDARRWRARAADAASYQVRVSSDAPFFRLPGVMFDLAVLLIFGAFISAILYIVVLYRRYGPQRRFRQETIRRGAAPSRGLALFNLEYWSRSDRAAFLTILLAGWFGIGLASGYTAGILRFAASPFSMAMGKLAGPVTIASFEKLPETAERDFLLALAYQQDGQRDKAERLYRQLPQYAESWNNLGVILKNAGREPEARQAFEQALRLNPLLPEAALNLGRPAQGLWAEAHARYLPGQPMLAPPRDRVWYGAFFGGHPAGLWLRALAGPFATAKPARIIPDLFDFLFERSRTRNWAAFMFICLGVAAAGLALALIFWIPARDVTQPPHKSQLWWEMLLPGTSPAWAALGGVVLLAWICLGLKDALFFWTGMPGIVTGIRVPNLLRSYAVPGVDNARVFRKYINPSWVWVYLAPALVFAANLVLVLRRRKTLG